MVFFPRICDSEMTEQKKKKSPETLLLRKTDQKLETYYCGYYGYHRILQISLPAMVHKLFPALVAGFSIPQVIFLADGL
jgi:hypothetical protein